MEGEVDFCLGFSPAFGSGSARHENLKDTHVQEFRSLVMGNQNGRMIGGMSGV